MGGDLIIFWLIREYHPNPPIMENTVAQNFSKPISKIDSFTKNISQERLYHLNSFFVWKFRIMAETYRISFGYLWLLQFFASISLKIKAMFLHIFKYVSTSCLYQFTLYIIYYIFYIYKIYIINYIIQLFSRGFFTKV